MAHELAEQHSIFMKIPKNWLILGKPKKMYLLLTWNAYAGRKWEKVVSGNGQYFV